MDICEKIAYIKGLAEGLQLDTESKHFRRQVVFTGGKMQFAGNFEPILRTASFRTATDTFAIQIYPAEFIRRSIVTYFPRTINHYFTAEKGNSAFRLPRR